MKRETSFDLEKGEKILVLDAGGKLTCINNKLLTHSKVSPIYFFENVNVEFEIAFLLHVSYANIQRQ